jgi:hypothetical protein
MQKKSLLKAASGLCALTAACSAPSTTPDLTPYAKTAELAAVAKSGAFADLSGKPDLDGYATKSSLSLVAISGDYNELINTPDLSAYVPIASLAPIAFTAKYVDLNGAPDLSVYATKDSLNSYASLASLSPIATSGSYSDLTNQPWSGDATATSTKATVTIDGSNQPPLTVTTPDFNASMRDQASDADGGAYPSQTSHWQSFTAGETGVLTRVDVNRWWDGPSTGYSLKIRDGEGTGGQVLYSQGGINLADGLVSINIDAPPALTKGHVYTWELTNNTGFILIGYNWATYAGGKGDFAENNAPDMDFQFATYLKPTAGVPTPRLSVASSGNVGVNTASPTDTLDVAGTLRVRGTKTPAATDPCHAGQIVWDADYVYVCVATDTWKRSQLAAY